MKEAVTFRVGPVPQKIVGRQVRDPDSIIAQSDRSEILRTSARSTIVKHATDQAYERMGLEKEDDNENNNASS